MGGTRMSEETPGTGTAEENGNVETDGQNGAQSGTDLATEVDKWKALARKHESQAKANSAAAKKLAEIEESKKSELEKLADQLKAAESAGTGHAMAALRLEVALDKAPEGMKPAKIRSLAKRLTGSTREELESDADELFAEFIQNEQNNPSKNGRPTPNLRRQVPVKDNTEQDTSAAMNDWLRRAAGR